jgi:hypothetical protein
MRAAQNRALFGIAGLMLGSLGLIVAMVAVYGGPFAPQQPVGVGIGEIAGDIIKSTWRELRGIEQPAPVQPGMDIDGMLRMAVPVLAVAAIVLAVIARVRRESRVLTRGTWALAVSAMLFQFLSWTILLVAGMFFLIGIMNNITGFFGAAEGHGQTGGEGGGGSGGGDGGAGWFDWLPGFGD